jgi:hypothetical protein
MLYLGFFPAFLDLSTLSLVDATLLVLTTVLAVGGVKVGYALDYFNSLLETVHLLKSPANAAHLERSIAQYKQGRVQEQDLADG